jgi:hypothetical protein
MTSITKCIAVMGSRYGPHECDSHGFSASGEHNPEVESFAALLKQKVKC